MSRNDSARYLHRVLKMQRRRRLSAAEEKQPCESAEPSITLSRMGDACGMPDSLLLHSHRSVNGRGLRHAESDDSVSPSELLELRLRVNQLQQQLRNKMVENAILTEAIEVARQLRDCCAHRHRR
jgi:transposase